MWYVTTTMYKATKSYTVTKCSPSGLSVKCLLANLWHYWQVVEPLAYSLVQLRLLEDLSWRNYVNSAISPLSSLSSFHHEEPLLPPVCSFHDTLYHSRLKATGPNDHGLNPLAPWAKISNFSKLFISEILSRHRKADWIDAILFSARYSGQCCSSSEHSFTRSPCLPQRAFHTTHFKMSITCLFQFLTWPQPPTNLDYHFLCVLYIPFTHSVICKVKEVSEAYKAQKAPEIYKIWNASFSHATPGWKSSNNCWEGEICDPQNLL